MNDRLQGALAAEFPTVMRELGGDVRETCMGWGITCGDGWFLILWELCVVLEPLGAEASQVKEKFGTLRFYLGSIGDEEAYAAALAAVGRAERRSAETCEECGRPGRASARQGWIRTRCEGCEVWP